ncbi:hypothetical protein [Corynebacterium heidelbergense]|uniref:Transmembrane protein n=1 Tax=Corynebacterium heidelbergense TaxID=2055947 RepID=A0A364V8I8_9CORY|nr:hypothetical protein [Corynebacterium heidelbergense]RAV32937.1 hypothetical protein DLJ54_00995 [Corynebacterium heidelbergense]
MSEKLTVAELLARNRREDADGAQPPRRRRHRSIEGGGISVAELTGSIPVVKTDEAGQAVAEKDQADSAAQQREPETPREAEPPRDSRDQQREPAAQSTAKREKPGERTAVMRPVSSAPSPSAAQTGQTPVVEGDDSGEASTGLIRARRRGKAAQADGSSSAKAEKTWGDVAKLEDTQRTDAVATDSAATEDAEDHGAARSADSRAETRGPGLAARRVSREAREEPRGMGSDVAYVERDPAATAAPAETAATPAPATNAGAETAGTELTGVPTADAEQDPTTEHGTTTDAEATDNGRPTSDIAELEENLDDDEIIEYEDNTISWPALIGQAILAIAAGVGVFFAFNLLWASMPTWVVLLLALAVTLLLVGVVHVLLRHSHRVHLLLAFLVGLLLTLGPRFIQGI